MGVDTAVAADQAIDTDFVTVIGLEVHTQLLTRSKMYCGCSAVYAGAAPNTHTCPVCLGLPGAMPVPNAAAFELGIMVGLALGCHIPGFNKLDRKNYVYPDLPKGYQISQYDLPLSVHGSLEFELDGKRRNAGITRVHLEEDTGRLVHRVDQRGHDISLVDLNRSGVPLMEIVGDPDLRSPEEAYAYLVALRRILRYLRASTGNMEEGAFRCDANISTRSRDESLVGAKVEVKNMNSFRSVERALRFEEQRQRAELRAGHTISQETRGWLEDRGVTIGQRTKEAANDYRYFPEPDIPTFEPELEVIEQVRERLPELPAARRERFITQYGLRLSDAAQLTSEREIADVFEATVEGDTTGDMPRLAANWILNDLIGLQGTRGLPANVLPLNADQLRDLLAAVASGELTGRAAKELLPHIATDDMPRDTARRLNLLSMNDDAEVQRAVEETLAANPAAVEDYRGGKKAAIGRLIGETMKRTGGRARPDAVREALQRELDTLGS